MIEKMIDTRRVKECLKIATEWEASGTAPELPSADGIVNLYERNLLDDQALAKHCNLVWSVETFANTLNILKRIKTNQQTIILWE